MANSESDRSVDASNIVVCEQDLIDTYSALADEFLQDILGMSLDRVLITDESSLSDFSFSGQPEGTLPEHGTLSQLHDAWDAWVVPRVCERYGIEPFKTNIRLVALFEAITAHQRKQVH